MTIPGTDPRDSDPRRWGLPVWGQRDEGPRNTYVPGPLPTAPMVNTYQWLPRVLGSGVIFGGVATLVLLSDQNGKVPAALLLLALWAAYGIPTWWKGGSGLRAVGDVLTVSSVRGTTEVRAGDVTRVVYVHQGASPDFRLMTRDGRGVFIATSRLERGHSTLFEWLRQFAPQADYDKRSLDIRDRLISRGLMGEVDGR